MTLLITIWSLSSCQKVNVPYLNDSAVDVTFSSKAVQGNQKEGLTKKTIQHIDYAVIVVGQKTYALPVYNLDGNIYTTSIKLDPGTYTLSKFLLMYANQTVADSSDDEIVYATPMEGSEYASFVNHPTGFSFEVASLNKTAVSVEVLLFNPADYQKFGFDFSILSQTTVREQQFTGRFIPNDPNNYSGSLYQSQTNGLQANMPAIFKIDVYRNNMFITSYNNENTLGAGALGVQYPDGNQTTDQFRFDLSIYVKSGSGFGYRFIHSWEFSDEQLLHHSSDGVVHFIIGDPRNTGTDYAFGPSADLPFSCTLTINRGFAPGSRGGYFDGTTNDVSVDYALSNHVYPSWCGTDTVSINLGHPYPMDIVSSLTPEQLPAYARTSERWNQLNWLFNHLDNYSFYDWDILQGASWMILNDWDGIGHSSVSDANQLVLKMVVDARMHSGFIPGYGQKAAVIFIPKQTNHDEQKPQVQLVFTLIELQ